MTYCQNYGDSPDCLGKIDERWTMNFTDVQPGAFLKWCSVCGPKAHVMDKAIQKAFIERPNFAENFEEAINKAYKKNLQ